jgi:hypothetical protein
MLGAAAIGTTLVPGLGDIVGAAADVAMFASDPTTRTLPNLVMSAAGVLPFVPGAAAVRAARGAPSPLEGTLDMSQAARMQTEYELAHEVAQRNAALPVEQGGLGLPLNNTAMDRAKAMGFDTPAYHGGTNDFLEFKSNNPTYASDRAEIANIYAEATGRHRGLREINASPNVMPLLLGGKKLTVSDLGRGIGDNIYDILSHGYYPDNLAKLLNETPRRRLVNDIKNYGYDRVEVTDILDLGGEQMQHMIPSGSNQIRSRFAAFDPAKRGSANLMAGAAGATIGLSALRNIQRDEQPQPD